MTATEPPTTTSPRRGYCAGLDVHQKTCDVALVAPEGKVARRWHIKTCPQMFDQFARELRALCGPAPVDLGLEASTAGKAVFQHLRKLGLSVHMGHPRKLEAILSSETKTDRNDAEELARLLQGRHFPEAYVPSEGISIDLLQDYSQGVADGTPSSHEPDRSPGSGWLHDPGKTPTLEFSNGHGTVLIGSPTRDSSKR